MKIQIDIPEDLNKALKFEKLRRDCNTLQEVVIELLEEWKKKGGGKS